MPAVGPGIVGPQWFEEFLEGGTEAGPESRWPFALTQGLVHPTDLVLTDVGCKAG